MLGAELASIFAIFTSQAWNMAFSFYQSLRTIPTELTEAADRIAVLGVRFAATIKGEDLAAMDAFIPTADRWKNAQ